jgi:hypothetical protein
MRIRRRLSMRAIHTIAWVMYRGEHHPRSSLSNKRNIATFNPAAATFNPVTKAGLHLLQFVEDEVQGRINDKFLNPRTAGVVVRIWLNGIEQI